MDWTGVTLIVAVLVVGLVGGLMHRRLDGRFRDVSDARQRLTEFTGNDPPAPSSRRVSSEVAAAAAVAASNAAAAATSPPPPPSDKLPARSLHVVRDGEPTGENGPAPVPERRPPVPDAGPVPDVAEMPGVVEAASTTAGGRLDPELLTRLGVGPAQATLLQFSSAFCAPCRAVRRISTEVVALLPAVRHVEVDAESHLAEVRELGIWRTPTLLLLDADGRVVKKATGVPSKPQLIAALAEVLPQP